MLDRMKFLWGQQDNRLQNQPARAGETKTQVIGQSTITVGRFSYGYEHADVYQWGEGANLQIGSFCSIAGGLQVFLGGNHRIDWASTFPFGQVFRKTLGEFDIPNHSQTNGDVVIGHDVWIGAKVTIMSGVRVGDGAVIAANATVARDVAPYEMVGGNPAKHIKFRFEEPVRARLLALAWWDQPLEVIQRIAPFLSTAPDEAALGRIEAVIAEAVPG